MISIPVSSSRDYSLARTRTVDVIRTARKISAEDGGRETFGFPFEKLNLRNLLRECTVLTTSFDKTNANCFPESVRFFS